MTPAIFYDQLTPEEYFADPTPKPAINNSIIGILTHKTPLHAWAAHPKLGQRPEDRKSTAATYRGSLVHRLSLGRGDEYAISLYDDYRTKEAREWRDDHVARNVIPVKQKDFDAAQAMADIARKEIERLTEGREYQTEIIMCWKEQTEHGDIWARGMADVYCPSLDLIVDVKTCASASDDAVDHAMTKYGYARQGVWYPRGIDAINGTPGRTRFVDLFVEQDYPFCSRPVYASEGMATGSTAEIERACATWAKCLHSDEWPGYADRTVTPKPWKVQEWMAAGIDVDLEVE